jgi:hypothetical protein
MEIKVGQWARKKFEICEIIDIIEWKKKEYLEPTEIEVVSFLQTLDISVVENGYNYKKEWNVYLKIKSLSEGELSISNFKDIKVADTPQELVEVGDLVELEKRIFQVGKVGDDCISYPTRYKSDVTKILTPNSNGGYDLQWESK